MKKPLWESGKRKEYLFYRQKKVAPPGDEPPPLLAFSLKLILAIQTIKLEGKQDLRISSEVTLSGGRYEVIYTWKALTHRR